MVWETCTPGLGNTRRLSKINNRGQRDEIMRIPCQFQVSRDRETLEACGVTSKYFYKTESPFLSKKPYNLYCLCDSHKLPEGTWEEDRISEEEFLVLQVMDE
jgi:hypothetical protein